MLLNIRESLKGTVVAGVVLLLFVVPLVLTGVGGSFLGSAAGTNAATVDGKDISEREVSRAIYQRRQQLLSRDGVDPSADFLKDENLRGPVLEQLTQRAAIVVSAKNSGVGVSDESLTETIVEIPDFQVDGKFDPQTYQRILRTVGFTPASFRAQLREDLVVAQHKQGIESSAFATDYELGALVKLTQQKRSFFTISVPESLVSESIAISDDEVAAHYEENKQDYVEAENLSVAYIELSTDGIAATLDVSEEDVKAQYEQELAAFKKTEEYEIAHILIESGDNQAAHISEVQQKISEGVDFSELVSAYSDDSGSKGSGGNLGVMTPGIFPEEFEQAVYALDEGQISEPVTTDAGVHFIKAVAKKVDTPPSYDTRKVAIEKALKLAEAEQIFVQQLERLGELTFSAADLAPAAEALRLTVKTTPAFTREQGQGIAANSEVREVAYSEQVLDKAYNSRVIELANNKAVVLRKAEHQPERTKTLEEMTATITKTLRETKIDAALQEIVARVIDKLQAGEAAEAIASAEKLEYKAFDAVARTSSDASFQVNNKAFAMSLGGQNIAYDSVEDRDGGLTVIALQSVTPGTKEDMQEQQYKGLATQLSLQTARFENSNYEEQVVANADIDIK